MQMKTLLLGVEWPILYNNGIRLCGGKKAINKFEPLSKTFDYLVVKWMKVPPWKAPMQYIHLLSKNGNLYNKFTVNIWPKRLNPKHILLL